MFRYRHFDLSSVISINNLDKVFDSGFRALQDINLDIDAGEIFALLGPNGAGKTTLISIICGLVNPSGGQALANGKDVVKQYRAARSQIGLVPQELTTESFETVWNSVSFSRGLFGKPKNPAHIESVLKSLSLWDKRNNQLMTLSGGMKRRVMIAKALSHEPRILFLDEPTAGVDVELRREMWEVVRGLREQGVTIVLTTHYLEEAEQMADRIGVINDGAIMLVEETSVLMQKLGQKSLTLHLEQPLTRIPHGLEAYELHLTDNGSEIVYTYNTRKTSTGVTSLFRDLEAAGIELHDVSTHSSSLEEIFVSLVREQA